MPKEKRCLSGSSVSHLTAEHGPTVTYQQFCNRTETVFPTNPNSMTLRLPTASLACSISLQLSQYSCEVAKVGLLGIVKSRSTVSLILGNFGKGSRRTTLTSFAKGRSTQCTTAASLMIDSRVWGKHTVLLPTHHPLTAHWLGLQDFFGFLF